MIALSILLSICLLLVAVLSFPVRIRIESNPVFHVKWLFVKVRIRSVGGSFKPELKLFNKTISLFKKKKSSKKKESDPAEKKKKKKKKPKITKKLVLDTLSDVAVKKALRVILRFCRRCLKAIRISVLKWNIGINDYYWQGILTGLLHSVPRTENLQLTGNFQEKNDFILVIKISVLRIIGAALLLLVRFPYIKAYRLYRRVYLQKT